MTESPEELLERQRRLAQCVGVNDARRHILMCCDQTGDWRFARSWLQRELRSA